MSSQESGPATHPSHAAGGAVSRIGSGVSIDGRLEAREDLVIEGRLKGQAVSFGTLTIAQGATVEAEVQARTVVVAGTLTGNITRAERVQISETASMTGDVVTGRIGISSGARFKGNITIKRS